MSNGRPPAIATLDPEAFEADQLAETWALVEAGTLAGEIDPRDSVPWCRDVAARLSLETKH